MSRERKYKAWDKKEKKWTQEFMIHPNGDVSWIYEHDVDDVMIGSDAEDLILFEFTGLLDKEGQEIYEGDKLDHKYDQEVFYDDRLGMYKVRSGRASEGYDDVPLWCMNERFKIIGHITEK